MDKQIQSRADYHRVLDETYKKVKALVPKRPSNKWLEEIWFQLDAMQRWTKDDRAPTPDERKHIKVGPISAYALCSNDNDEDLMALRPTLSELHWYFVYWEDGA